MDNQRSPPKKKFFKRLLPQSRSDNHLPGQSGSTRANASQPSLHQDASHSEPSISRPFRNIFKSRHSYSASQSSRPGPITPALSPQDRSSDGQNQSSTSPVSNVNHSQDTNPEETGLLDPRNKIEDAKKANADTEGFPGAARNMPSVSDNLQSALNTVDTVSPIIASLKVFNSIANAIADIHPYAKAVLSIFTCASQMILNQQDRDDAVHDLLRKLSEVYEFINDERLTGIATMKDLYEKLAGQTLECADFIVNYSKTKSAWKRLRKNAFEETDSVIQGYNDVLDNLMQQFRDEALRDIVVNVHHFVEGMDFKDMIYAEGAGRDGSKCCLPGTRENLLSEIKHWIYSEGEDIQQVFWLKGTAGKGKSAIAHTIADLYNARMAFFCFNREQGAERRHEKIFTTIARDLADHDPVVRQTLADVIRDNNELRHTTDIVRQWRVLISGPINAAGKVNTPPVLIIIDALDESGDARSREQILRVLSGKQGTISPDKVNFPKNIRVLVTSRPLDDIHKYLHDAPHVHIVSMDDTLHVSKESSERDVQRYISTLLRDVEDLNDRDFNKLAVKSDGLFEWARLACEYILGTNMVGQDPQERFEGVLAGTSEKGTRLLDGMYRRILEDVMPEDMWQEAIPVFCSVMGQILGSLEPLSCTALTVMRHHYAGDRRYRVEKVIRPLGSLVTGTSDSHIPIRPLHASFYDFLTDESRSKGFYVDVALAQRNLAFASLGVMKDQLRFNICSLESSYLPNSAIPNLEERVKVSISTELSYSCRFWGTHVSATSVERSLVDEVKAFFDDERLLFWLEVVSLLKVVGGSVATLSCIADWLMGQSEFTDTADAVEDIRRFVRTCAQAILCSTPHLYLSALPFAPTQSTIFKKFIARFPHTLRVVAGHVAHWPSMEKTISVVSDANTIAISPDGRRIVCGSEDGTIRIRDMETGEELCAPLIGHTGRIWSIAISPNGHRVVSGSKDSTIRIWDADTGEPLGDPLLGHKRDVESVSILPNGNRIVSGSSDGSIRVWDIETGKALGAPLTGHTSNVTCVAVFPDGIRIVSGSYDNTIRIWDIVTGNALGAPLLGHTDRVGRVAISHSRNIIVSCSDDRAIRMWDATTGDALCVLHGHTNEINTLAMSPDGDYIISGSTDLTIRLWDVDTCQELGMPLQGHTRTVLCIAVSPDGRRLVSSSMDHTIRLWEAGTRNALTAPLERGGGGGILSVAISQDGTRIVTGSRDHMVRVWDAYTGKPLLASLQGHTDSVRCVAISPVGNLIVSGSSDCTIRMWDLMTGEALRTLLQGHSGTVRTLAISPDGSRIVSGSDDKTIRLWDAVTGDALGTPLRGHTDEIWSVAIPLDGNLIISGSWDKTIRVWNAKTGEALSAPLQGHTDGVFSVAISRDGRIVSGSADRTLRLWDIATHKAFGDPLKGHTSRVRFVTISLDGNFIVSCSDDNTIRVWDTLSGEALGAPLRGHNGWVWSIAISRDSKRIVSCSEDATIRIWDLEFFTQKLQSFKPSTICFSSDPIHALSSSSSFLRGELGTPVPLIPNEDGWVVGPDGRLLLWVPASLYPVVYVPNVIGTLNEVLEVDLSHFAHGESWAGCRGHDSTPL